jgi:hypothetical protein
MLTSASRLSAPVVAAWGLGIDSAAMIIEWVARGLPLSAVTLACQVLVLILFFLHDEMMDLAGRCANLKTWPRPT